MTFTINNGPISIFLNHRSDQLLVYQLNGEPVFFVEPPAFEIDGQPVTARLDEIYEIEPPVRLSNGCTEYKFAGQLSANKAIILQLILRTSPDNPVVRYRFRLLSTDHHRMTKSDGKDMLTYARYSFPNPTKTQEISLSEFNQLLHSYHLVEREIPLTHYQAGLAIVGPILAASLGKDCALFAYEHGSNAPNTYIQFRLGSENLSRNTASIEAVKGNYYHKQPLDQEHPFESIWLQMVGIEGSLDELAACYRDYTLSFHSLYPATRQPKIFYNTWNFQERNFHWHGRPYLESMNAARMLAEIDIAHRLGVDVFVIDTGWYARTGDWLVDEGRFPDGLAVIKERITAHGMELGLWFNPNAAALTSRLHSEYRDCAITRNGREPDPFRVWETEESRSFCLVSRYAQAFADELIRINRELGVTYFKWDGVSQEGGCDSPNHFHGTDENPAQERADCWEFELVSSLVKIAERVCEACPDAIVDLDLTESGRALGLAFLSTGKQFLINNGPYYGSYDIPTPGTNENLLFYPGSARATLCRSALAYDRWIPSILFLTHFFPDDSPESIPHWSQPQGKANSLEVNLASLILGGNGLWGDLLTLSPQGNEYTANVLTAYKRVRNAITRASPVRSGSIGASPEIHEKIFDKEGVVVIFSPRTGHYATITHSPTGEVLWCSQGVSTAQNSQDLTRIEAVFDKPGAKIIFFHDKK